MRACVRYHQCFLLFSSTGAQTRGMEHARCRHACSIQTRRTASLSRVHAASLLSLPAPSGRLLRSCCRRCDNWPTDMTLRAPVGDSPGKERRRRCRRSPPLVVVSQSWLRGTLYTVDAHIEALVDEGDVASSFVPGLAVSSRGAKAATVSATAHRFAVVLGRLATQVITNVRHLEF